MRPLATEWRHLTPRPEHGRRFSRPLFGLTLSLATAGATIGGSSALAAVDDNWVGSAISQMQSEQGQEPGHRRRYRSSAEDEADPGDDGVRPQRSTPVKGKGARRDRGGDRLASLGRDLAPAQLRPLSVIEWARPKLETVLMPNEVAP